MINKKIWNINLPVLKSAFVTNISPKQYDTASNLFKIALYKDMEKYDLTGLTVQAVFKKADGTISYLPCTITNAASGELEIDITSQVLAIAAEVECEIRITGTEGELLIAPKFYFKVYESLNIDGAVESQDEFPVLVELLNRVETVETELQNITPEQIAQVTTNEQTRQDNETARQAAEAERAGFYAGFNAQLAEKVQNFKIKNEIMNGDFSQGITGWNKLGGVLSVSNNILTITGDGSSPTPRIYGTDTIEYVPGRKIYTKAKVKVNNSVSNYIRMSLSDTVAEKVLGSQINAPIMSGQVYELIDIFTIPVTTVIGKLDVLILNNYSDAETANGKTMELQYIVAIDLTKVFGAGNEPTKLEMDELMKVIPNQWWDGELELTQQQYVSWLLSFIREKANKAQEAWIPLTLLNGATVGSGLTVGCYKDTLGVVRYKGRVVVSTPSVVQVSIPVGYRTNEAKYFTIPRVDTATGVNRADVSASGITIYATGAFDLSCISYKAEA